MVPDPIALFTEWLDQALKAELPEPNAMTVATATADGVPSARVVLLRGYDEHGFVFFTDYRSQKGVELSTNPRTALVFYWSALDRQVRIVGSAAKIRERSRRRTFAPDHGAADWVRGFPIRARSFRAARCSTTSCPSWRAAIRARTFRCRRTGEDFASGRRPWSSGKAVRAACTTASATVAKATSGGSNGYRPEKKVSPFLVERDAALSAPADGSTLTSPWRNWAGGRYARVRGVTLVGYVTVIPKWQP